MSDIELTISVLPLFYVYIIQGMLVTALNGLFAYAIAKTAVLRRLYVVQVSQMIVDAATGISLILAGIGRLILTYMNLATTHTSKAFCMLMPWNIIAIWSEPMMALCMLMVSIDRLIAVLFPLIYFKKNFTLQVYQVYLWNIFLCPLIITSWVFSAHGTIDELSPYCWTARSMVRPFKMIFFDIRIIAASGSVVICLVGFIISLKYTRRIRKTHSGHNMVTAFERRQLRLTVTMSVACVFTLILYVLPVCVNLTLGNTSNKLVLSALAIYTAISTNLNPITNIAIITMRQKDIKEQVINVLPTFITRAFYMNKSYVVRKSPSTINTQ